MVIEGAPVDCSTSPIKLVMYVIGSTVISCPWRKLVERIKFVNHTTSKVLRDVIFILKYNKESKKLNTVQLQIQEFLDVGGSQASPYTFSSPVRGI